jgi:type VI protein secretion system component Hcp
MKATFGFALTALFFALTASVRGGDVHYFCSIKDPNITGDSTARGFEGQIAATGFEFQVASGNTYFVLQKSIDSATTQLGSLLVSGDSNISTATLTGVFIKGERISRPVRYFSIVLNGLTLHSVNIADAGAADSLPHENATFSFSTAVITTYAPTNSGGSIATGTATITNPGSP